MIVTENKVENVPVLRFEEFDEEWIIKTLGDIATFSKGKGISKADISENGIHECIRYGELYTHYAEKIETIKSKTNIKDTKLVYSEFNDVIIPASGETPIDIATASCVLKKGVILGGDLNIIKSNVNGIFLSYYLNSTKKKNIARLSQGSSVTHLYPVHLRILKLNIPCEEEQQKIANFLSSVDKKIEQLSQKVSLLEQYKKGVMQQIFSQQIRFKDENGEEFAGEWRSFTLKHLIKDLQSGISVNSEDRPIANELEYGILKTSAVANGVFTKNENKKIVDEEVSRAKLNPTKNEIIISRMNTPQLVGQCGYVDKTYTNLFVPDRLWQTITYTDKCNNRWLSYFLITDRVRYNLKSIATGTSGTMKNISKPNFLGINVNLPSLPEQEKIANFLSSIDNKINQTQQQLEQTQAFKKGLLQQMFV